MITNGSTFFNEVKAPRSIETDEMLPRKRWSDYDTIFDFNNNTNYYNNIFGSVDNLKNDDPSPNGTFNGTALFEIDSIKSKSGLKQNFDFDPQDHTKSRSNKVIYKRRNAVSELDLTLIGKGQTYRKSEGRWQSLRRKISHTTTVRCIFFFFFVLVSFLYLLILLRVPCRVRVAWVFITYTNLP